MEEKHNYVYGVSWNSLIWSRPVDGSGTWRQIPGTLKQITASGKNDISLLEAMHRELGVEVWESEAV